MREYRHSIISKIVLSVVLVVSGALLLFAYYDYLETKQSSLLELHALAAKKTDRLALNLSLPVWEVDKNWLNKVIDSEMADKQVHAIAVYTSDEGFYAGKARDSSWKTISMEAVELTSLADKDLIRKAEQISYQGEEIGSVQVFVSKRWMENALADRMMFELVSLSVFAVLIIAILVYSLNAIVVSRVNAILRQSRQIASGEYDQQIDIISQDEIGELSRGIHHMQRSIQEREAQIKASEYRFRSLVNNAAEAFYLIDMQARFIDVNRMASTMTGYSREELLTMGVADLQVEFPVEKLMKLLLSLNIGESRTLMGRHKRKDNSTYPTEIRLSVVEMEEQKYCIALVADITDRLQAEEKIQLYSQAMEQSGEAIIVTDTAGSIEHVNPAFTQITGYSEDEVIGKNARILKSGNQRTGFYRQMWHSIAAGNVWQKKVVNRKKSGEFYPCMLTVSPIKNSRGEIAHFIGIQQDLEAFEMMEQQFHQSQKMEAIGTLVGGIAHDFNNTLAGITGNIYLAKKAAADLPDVQQRLNSINTLAFSAASMIQKLLTFSRKGIVQKHAFEFVPFIKETIKLHQVSIPESIKLNVNIQPEHMQVFGDINQLQQALMNVLNNAMDAVESVESPEISFTVSAYDPDASFYEKFPESEAGRYVLIAVEDNGIGMPQENLVHIFEPFFTTKEQGKGTGLGLAMVFGSVQTHKGQVEVSTSDQPPTGTIVRIYLPLIEAGEGMETQEGNQDVVEGNGETILLVDDNELVLSTEQEVLEGLGYKVMTATSGKEAVNQYQQFQQEIDLLILDVVMPELGGPDALKQIQQINPDVKAIFATGYDKQSSLKRAKLTKSALVLTKPFEIHHLSQMIQKVLASP